MQGYRDKNFIEMLRAGDYETLFDFLDQFTEKFNEPTGEFYMHYFNMIGRHSGRDARDKYADRYFPYCHPDFKRQKIEAFRNAMNSAATTSPQPKKGLFRKFFS